ncbi:MAG: hypothetical protein M0022_01945 [Desulfobacteraceae bacterium]|nr:hypothetical protein [Desulfobacteraceae bacterium]
MLSQGLKRKAVLLSLIEAMNREESWCSETHIQKCIYFLQEGFGVPTGYEFILYKHGPFSFELRDELAEMQANDFINIKPQPPYGPSFLLGPLASALKERFPKTLKKYKKSYKYVAENISKGNVSDLEKIATALYIIKEEKIEKMNACARRLNAIKPHISIDDAYDACIRVTNLLNKI